MIVRPTGMLTALDLVEKIQVSIANQYVWELVGSLRDEAIRRASAAINNAPAAFLHKPGKPINQIFWRIPSTTEWGDTFIVQGGLNSTASISTISHKSQYADLPKGGVVWVFLNDHGEISLDRAKRLRAEGVLPDSLEEKFQSIEPMVGYTLLIREKDFQLSNHKLDKDLSEGNNVRRLGRPSHPAKRWFTDNWENLKHLSIKMQLRSMDDAICDGSLDVENLGLPSEETIKTWRRQMKTK